ncbi:phosphatase PAP2 family protein [Klenkia sp. LSe6-5]|uniref:Phosphatase PAP2 family protein n=1 Tax=Klenkia sesuvii TaxID=3103137 RepID=A0ABU8DWK4_9ACTN
MPRLSRAAARRWDARLQARIGRLPASRADGVLRQLSQAADHGKLWLAVGLALGAKQGAPRRAAARGLGSLLVSSALVNVVLKPVFGRVRPDPAGAAAADRVLDRTPHTLSFPSGHSASAAAFATGVAMESPWAGALVAPVALGVGYSRVHVGVHYPGDVLAGMAVGGAVAAATRHWWPVRPSTPARVRPTERAPALPGGAGLHVAVNPRSGRADYDPAADIAALLPGAVVVEIDDEHSVTDVLEEAVRAGARALGVAGGDGSVAAAAAVALAHGLPLAVLPAGTLNHFARDVGVATPVEAARAVEAGDGVLVDVAAVNGVPFLNTASIGSYPEMVRRRDALRGKLGTWLALTVAAGQVLRTGQPVELEVDGRRTSAWILFVGNGVYTPRGLSPAWRPALDDGLLDVQYLRADLRWGRTRAVLATLLGASERSRSYRQFQVPRLTVRSLSGPQAVAYDGETGDAGTEFVFTKRQRLVVYRLR